MFYCILYFMIMVMIACQSEGQAEQIGKHLVKEKLAACVQVVPKVDSLFFWQNKIQYAEESLLLAKTLESKWNALEKAVKKLHSYENPEIIALPVAHISKSYLAWMEKELT